MLFPSVLRFITCPALPSPSSLLLSIPSSHPFLPHVDDFIVWSLIHSLPLTHTHSLTHPSVRASIHRYELLTGETPFSDPEMNRTFTKIAHANHSLKNAFGGIPSYAKDLIKKLLTTTPSLRLGMLGGYIVFVICVCVCVLFVVCCLS